MNGNAKRVLFFVPYGSWKVHHQVDAVLGAALKLRRCNICVVGCDGIFENCPCAGNPPTRQACQDCVKSGFELFSAFGLPITYLGSLLEQKDIQECREWSNNVQPSDFLKAKGGVLYERPGIRLSIDNSKQFFFSIAVANGK